jgi:hypothetical protein
MLSGTPPFYEDDGRPMEDAILSGTYEFPATESGGRARSLPLLRRESTRRRV